MQIYAQGVQIQRSGYQLVINTGKKKCSTAKKSGQKYICACKYKKTQQKDNNCLYAPDKKINYPKKVLI